MQLATVAMGKAIGIFYVQEIHCQQFTSLTGPARSSYKCFFAYNTKVFFKKKNTPPLRANVFISESTERQLLFTYFRHIRQMAEVI